MPTDRTIESSRRWYSRMMRLYPSDFRSEYGESMVQLFADQCRSAVREAGRRGMATLWILTLGDLAVSALREQFASSNTGAGLLDAPTNKPLPWKGVAVVLLPCLVFFYGQLSQLTGQDTFFLMVRRAAFFLIIPVLIVWLLTRKFPVWGLIPLGMFYRTIVDRIPLEVDLQYGGLFRRFVNSLTGSSLDTLITRRFIAYLMTHTMEIKILIIAFLLSTAVFLIIWIARRGGFARSSWILLGVFLMLTIVEIIQGLYFSWINLLNISSEHYFYESVTSILENIAWSALYGFLSTIGFLLLIIVGVLLARRYGRLALLLPFGYLIPSVILGRFDNSTGHIYSLFWISVSVLAYRVLVTLVAPIWIVRSASDHAQKRAGAIALAVAFGILVTTHAGFFSASYLAYGPFTMGVLDYYYSFSPDLLILAGIALAITLYKSSAPAQTIVASPQIAVEKTSD